MGPHGKRNAIFALLATFFLSLSFFMSQLALPFAPLAVTPSSSRSLTLRQGYNQNLTPASSPNSLYQPLTGILGAGSGAYVDTSFYYSRNDCSGNFGADGSGYWFKEYVGENAQDWGVLYWNIHHPVSFSFRYSVTEIPQSARSWGFYSEKNGGGMAFTQSFSVPSSGANNLSFEVSALSLSFTPESLSLAYHLDSIYSLFFYLNEITISYLC